LSETTITGSIISGLLQSSHELIVGIGGHCPEHSAASNKQFIVVFQSIIKGDFLGHRLSAASRVLSLAFTIIAFLETIWSTRSLTFVTRSFLVGALTLALRPLAILDSPIFTVLTTMVFAALCISSSSLVVGGRS
jgi:hypothetical protein